MSLFSLYAVHGHFSLYSYLSPLIQIAFFPPPPLILHQSFPPLQASFTSNSFSSLSMWRTWDGEVLSFHKPVFPPRLRATLCQFVCSASVGFAWYCVCQTLFSFSSASHWNTYPVAGELSYPLPLRSWAYEVSLPTAIASGDLDSWRSSDTENLVLTLWQEANRGWWDRTVGHLES